MTKRVRENQVSFLNLHKHIPQKDLRTHFYRTYLNTHDMAVVKCAHKWNHPFKFENLAHYVQHGYLDVMRFIHEKGVLGTVPYWHSLLHRAIAAGQLPMSKWLFIHLTAIHDSHYAWFFAAAAMHGHVSCLEWLVSLAPRNGIALLQARHTAIEYSQLGILDWFFVNQRAFMTHLLPYIAASGKIAPLRWLLDKGVRDGGEMACRRAREEGHPDAVAVLKEYGLRE
jgi:hypothetical protein